MPRPVSTRWKLWVVSSTRIGCVKRMLVDILSAGAANKVQLSTTMNADEAVARGAALQSAILSPRFKVLPYDIQEAQPFPISIAWQEEAEGGGAQTPNSVVMFDRGLNFPIVRRVTLKQRGDFVVESAYDAETSAKYGYPADEPKAIATFTIKETPARHRPKAAKRPKRKRALAKRRRKRRRR